MSKERADALRQFVRTEIEQYKAREIRKLSSLEELQERFRYKSVYSVSNTLKRERHFMSKIIYPEVLTPSRKLAWLVGLVSGGGYVALGNRGYNVEVYSSNKELLETFQSVVEDLFRVNVYLMRDNAIFYSKSLAIAFGDLRRSLWTETLVNKHNWIYTNPDYIWGFLEGFFELRGSVRSNYIKLNTSYTKIANCLGDLLYTGGVSSSRLQRDHSKHEGISGVCIGVLRDQKVFAEHVHSVTPKKEAQLEKLRNRIGKHYCTSEREIIDEWFCLNKILQHEPTSHEIRKLRSENKTLFAANTYTYHFGMDGDSKSFTLATQRLKEITGLGRSDDSVAETR